MNCREFIGHAKSLPHFSPPGFRAAIVSVLALFFCLTHDGQFDKEGLLIFYTCNSLCESQPVWFQSSLACNETIIAHSKLLPSTSKYLFPCATVSVSFYCVRSSRVICIVNSVKYLDEPFLLIE